MAIQPLATNDFQSYLVGETPSKEMESSNKMPARFLDFYSAIIQFCLKYQEAIQNLVEPIAMETDIAISKHITKYFNESDEEFNKIKEKLGASTSKIKEVVESLNGREILNDTEIREKLEDLIHEHKSDIIKEITDKLDVHGTSLVQKTYEKIMSGEDLSPSSSSSSSENALSGVTLNGKDVAEMGAQYTKQVEAFSLRVGVNVLTRFQNFAEKTLGVVKYFATTVNKMVSYFGKKSSAEALKGKEAIDAAKVLGFHVKEIEREAEERRKREAGIIEASALKGRKKAIYRLKQFLSWTGVGLFRMFVNRKFWFKAALFLTLNSVLGIGFFHTLGLWILFPKALKLLNNVWNRTVKLFTGIFNFSKNIFDKVFKNSLSKFFYTAMRGFFSTYAGAYALGWMFGFIWVGVKKLFNWASIEKNEETRITRFQEFEAQIDIYKEDIEKKYKEYKDIPKILFERLEKTPFFQASILLLNGAWWTIKKAVKVTRDYIIPALPAIGYLLSMITGRDIRNFALARTGYLIGMRGLAKAGMAFKLRGGLAGILLSAAIIGSGYTYHRWREKDIKERQERINEFQTNQFSLAEGLSDVLNGGMKTTQGLITQMFNGNFKGEENKEKRESIRNKAEDMFSIADAVELQYNKYNTYVEALANYYANNEKLNINSIPAVPEIFIEEIFSWNGKPLYSLINTVKKLPPKTQLLAIKAFLESKTNTVNNLFIEFQKFLKNSDSESIERMDFSSYDIGAFYSSLNDIKAMTASIKLDDSFFAISNLRSISSNQLEKLSTSNPYLFSKNNSSLFKIFGGKNITVEAATPSRTALENHNGGPLYFSKAVFTDKELAEAFEKLKTKGIPIVNTKDEFESLPLLIKYLYSTGAIKNPGKFNAEYALSKIEKKKIKTEFETIIKSRQKEHERAARIISGNEILWNSKEDIAGRFKIEEVFRHIIEILKISIISQIDSIIDTLNVAEDKKNEYKNKYKNSFEEIINHYTNNFINNFIRTADLESIRRNDVENEVKEVLVKSLEELKRTEQKSDIGSQIFDNEAIKDISNFVKSKMDENKEDIDAVFVNLLSILKDPVAKLENTVENIIGT